MITEKPIRSKACSAYCISCNKAVKTIQSHTLPTNVISNELGIFLKPKTQPAFRPCQHSTYDLIGTIAKYSYAMVNSDVEDMRARQQLTLTSFKPWDGPIDVTKSKARLQGYFRTLDKVLFAGSLKPYTVVNFSTKLDASESLGTTSLDSESTVNEPRVYIKISTKLETFDAAAPDRQGRAILETLLHEMVHAFLILFHCHCSGCLAEHITAIGITGHGDAFATLAEEISQFTCKYLDDLEIPGIEDDVQEELKALRKYACASLLRRTPAQAHRDLHAATEA